MKRVQPVFFLCCLWAPMLATGPMAAGPGDGQPLTAVHPSYDLTNLMPTGLTDGISGLDFLSDGRMVAATWKNTTWGIDAPVKDILILSGVQGDDRSKITSVKIATGFSDAHGLKVVNDSIYVLHKHQLTLLADVDKDGTYEVRKKVSDGWEFDGNHHQFEFGLLYKDGWFYAALGNKDPFAPQGLDRGNLIRINKATGAYERIAGGLREANGLAFGPEDQVFVTDNQGEWVHTNKLIAVEQGKFYGYEGNDSNFFQKQGLPLSPPAVWIPYGEMSTSVTQPILIRSGTYKNQMVAGDIVYGGMGRYFVEKVAGKWQGMCARFSGGFSAGIQRLTEGPDGNIYLGELGGVSAWSWKDTRYGLERLHYNGKAAFEVLTVKARKGGLELEFTKTLGATAPVAADFRVDLCEYQVKRTKDYGGPKVNLQNNVSVAEVRMDPDRKRVFLGIPSLVAGKVAAVKLLGLKSEAGEAPWTTEYWYTLNNLSESAPFSADPVPVRNPAFPQGNTKASLSPDGPFRLRISAPEPGLVLTFEDLSGRILHRRILEATGNLVLAVPETGGGVRFAVLRRPGRGNPLSVLKLLRTRP